MSYSIDDLFEFREVKGDYFLVKYLKRDDPTVTELEIPEEYNGLPVTRIDPQAFESAEYLKSVKLPKSLKELCFGVFRFCRELERVEFGGLPWFAFGVFSGCPKLPPETIVMGLVRFADITKPIPAGDLQFITETIPNMPCDCFRRDVFEILAKNNCFRKCDLTFLLKRIIEANKSELFPLAEEYGMLANAELADALVEYSAEHGKTEITAYLLDLKNRKFGFKKGGDLDL